jgi:iron complex transport system substrate-binding protein
MLTEELYLLGVEDRLVGVTIYCSRPPAAQEKEKVGTVVEVDIEKIISLEPDLVLSTSLTNPKAKEKLERLGIRVVNFPAPGNFLELCEQFLELAKLVNREREAEEIIRQVKFDVDLIREGVKHLSTPKVFIQIGAKPLFAANKDYFIHDFIEFAGGINIAGSSKSGLYSREQVIKDNPDIIIIATMGILGKKEKQTWLKFKTLKAAKNNRIYIVDAYKLCSPTPVTFVESLKDIVRLLHSK